MKTRDEIIAECTTALQACFNYYSDEPLDEYVIGAVRGLLVVTLPATIPTEQWQGYADLCTAHFLEEYEEESSNTGEPKP